MDSFYFMIMLYFMKHIIHMWCVGGVALFVFPALQSASRKSKSVSYKQNKDSDLLFTLSTINNIFFYYFPYVETKQDKNN